jgi:hypothetical protein
VVSKQKNPNQGKIHPHNFFSTPKTIPLVVIGHASVCFNFWEKHEIGGIKYRKFTIRNQAIFQKEFFASIGPSPAYW